MLNFNMMILVAQPGEGFVLKVTKMKNYTNYHIHTKYSDGLAWPEEYVAKAIELGFSGIGFSDHAPFIVEKDWALPKYKLVKYCEHIRSLKLKYQDQIDIFLGLEIDYIPNQMGVYTFEKAGLDYTIGSIHFLSSGLNQELFGFDITYEEFIAGLDKFFNHDIKKAVQIYYRKISEMVTLAKPNIIGHFDLIKKFNKDQQFFREEEIWYQDSVAECLENVAKSGCIIELNTRGLYKELSTDFYPSTWILQRAQKLKIPVTISTDAHAPENLASEYEKAAAHLKALGFKEIFVLDKKAHWVAKSF